MKRERLRDEDDTPLISTVDYKDEYLCTHFKVTVDNPPSNVRSCAVSVCECGETDTRDTKYLGILGQRFYLPFKVPLSLVHTRSLFP